MSTLGEKVRTGNFEEDARSGYYNQDGSRWREDFRSFLLAQGVPERYVSKVESYCYEKVHAHGYSEVLNAAYGVIEIFQENNGILPVEAVAAHPSAEKLANQQVCGGGKYMPDLTSIEIVVNGANELTARSERIASLEDELTRTKRALEIARKDLEAYANKDHWTYNTYGYQAVFEDPETPSWHGYYRAEKSLEAIRKELDE